MAKTSPKAKTPKAAATEPKPKAEPKAKPAKAASKGKAPKKGAAKAPKAKAQPQPGPETFEPFPEPQRKSLSERFWHSLGMRAAKQETKAHQREAEVEYLEQQAEQQRIAAAAEAKRAHDAEERRKAAISARELKRAAIEEERRMKADAAQARRDAKQAKARAEREAKETQAREEREAKEAKVQAAREAKEAKAAAARQAEEDRRAAEQAAREQAAREAEEERMRAEHEREVAAAAAAAEAERQERAQRKAEEEAAKEAEREERARRKAEEAERAEQERAERAARKAAEKAAAEAEKAAEAARKAQEEAEAAALALQRRKSPRGPADDDAAPAKGGKKVVVHDKGEAQEDDEGDEAAADDAEAEPVVQLRERGQPDRSEPQTDLDRHADKLAAELAARRSKPITIEAEEDAVPMLPVGRKAAADDEAEEPLQLDPAPPARIPEMAAPKGLSIPEHYMLLAMEGTWDERIERAKPGALGGGLTGALLLELVMQGAVKVQRDRFVLDNADLDAADEAVARKLQQFDRLPSLEAMAELAKWLPQLLPAYKDRMMARGLIEHRQWRHLGIFYRSQTALVDQDAQERLRNKLARAIAGGGRPDAPTILSLGLLEATGLFGVVVPEGAQAYNRKRLNGLLGGKDVMGYKVDDQLKGIQEIAVRTILDNVRLMTTRG